MPKVVYLCVLYCVFLINTLAYILNFFCQHTDFSNIINDRGKTFSVVEIEFFTAMDFNFVGVILI